MSTPAGRGSRATHGGMMEAPDGPWSSQDARALHAFVRELQIVAGRINFDCPLTEAFAPVLDRIPQEPAPLAFWIIQGLAVQTLEHAAAQLDIPLVAGLHLQTVSEAGTPEQLRIAITKCVEEYAASTARHRCGDPRVDRALEYLNSNYQRATLTLEEVSRHVRLSRWHLGRLLARHIGASFRGVIRQLRMERATQLLAEDLLSVKQIAADLGYPYATEFNRDFKCSFGVSPTAWRAQRRRVAING